jgi:hypothetical protein
MIDCIVGYHLNPWTCGIAKFNAILARQLEVPVAGFVDYPEGRYRRPLLSVKFSEFTPEHEPLLERWIRERAGEYELFLHAVGDTDIERRLIANASRVYCGNRELIHDLRDLRPDSVELFCPGTIMTPHRIRGTELQIFTFGMAHKIRVEHYRKLQRLLEQTGRSYKVFVSTALHEGTNFDGSFVVRFEELQEIFGPHVYFMGYLSDTAVFNHLLDATFLAAFFEHGLRANNTTVNAALEYGCAVVTNLDQFSPVGYEHMSTVLDINRLETLPGPEALERIGRAARDVAGGLYGWDRLVERIKSMTPEEKGI